MCAIATIVIIATTTVTIATTTVTIASTLDGNGSNVEWCIVLSILVFVHVCAWM